MKIPRLWSYNLVTTVTVSAIFAVLWGCLMVLFGSGLAAGSFALSLGLGIVACVLIFAFMLELPIGSWQQNLLYEIFPASVCAALVGLGPATLVFVLRIPGLVGLGGYTAGLREFYLPLLLTMGLGGVSYLIVRLVARPYDWWTRLRQRSLVWEIAHAQLRLVVVGTVVLLIVIIVLFFTRLGSGFDLSPENFLQLITMLIGIVGLFGIVTGLLLGIVVVPAAILSYFSAQRITRRINNLIIATGTLREGDYQTRVLVEGQDEVARLQTDFNVMAEIMEQDVHNLQAQREAVEDLLESRRRLFAGVSHELRTPLSILKSYLEAIQKRSKGPPDLQEYLAVMEQETAHLQRLINDLFTLARSDAGHLEITVAPLEVGPVLKRTVEAAQLQAWQSKKLEVGLEMPSEVPRVLVDETRLEQILNNLLRNAVRHTPPGGIVAASVEEEAETLAIYIRDTGEGIAPTDLPHIWERFYRSAEARALDPGGAGLGLSLVRELTEAMGGTIAVESVPGEGTCFKLRFPFIPQPVLRQF
jgi:signal transduction histidine kinase